MKGFVKWLSTPFSFPDFSFWRLAGVSLAFDLLHALLASHWSGIRRGPPYEPRPLCARWFMLAEAFVLFAAIAVAIDNIGKMLKLEIRPKR